MAFVPTSFRYSVLLLTLAAIPACLRAETYTYPQLVSRMTDLRQLAVLPALGEKMSLASSYDRGSKYDAVHDKYVNWGANADGSGIIRREGDESVFADIQGPGCIWRTWSATAGNGHVKIYLDGATTPTVDLPFVDYFSGKVRRSTVPISPMNSSGKRRVLIITRRFPSRNRARSSAIPAGAVITSSPTRSFRRGRSCRLFR